MIYILHFSRPFHHAQHYIGYTGKDDAEDRLKRHREGRGARLLAAVAQAGITWEITAVLPGDRTEERRLHRLNNTRKLCPLCQYLTREKATQ